jgi:hypothetical protein
MFGDVETSLRRGWEESGELTAWGDVREAVRGGFDRTLDCTTR